MANNSLISISLIGNGKKVFKVYMKQPVLNENGHCGIGVLCPCFGAADEVKVFGDQLLIFNLTEDPLEEHPLLQKESLE
jgi:hypothetical protein